MINLRSDNESKVFPEIMEYLNEINEFKSKAYGEDEITIKAKNLLNNFFEKKVDVFFLSTGTATNAISLSSLSPSFGGILSSDIAHINLDECGAPEFFSGGAKLLPIKTENGLISSLCLEKKLSKMGYHGIHEILPSTLSITQISELGTAYSLDQIKDISKISHKNNLKIHMDGARFANACAHLNCTPAETTWKSGIDILSLGATKNGAMSCELVIVFNRELSLNIDRRQKRAGHLLSKQKFIAAQIIKWIEKNRWLNAAKKANNNTKDIAKVFKKAKVNILHPIDGNMIFIEIEKKLENKLKKYIEFYNWPANKNTIRLVIPWNIENKDVNFIKNIFPNLV